MTASQVGYDNVLGWVKGMLAGSHRTVISTVGWIVLSVLVAQRLTPAALARAIPAEEEGSGRNRLRRVKRWWAGPALDLGTVVPRLIGLALRLLPTDRQVLVAVDTTRTGRWEIWQAGIVFAGRTLPVAWAVVPYPWPKGRFRETTLALVRQLQDSFPTGLAWVFVADRGFPSVELFVRLLERETGWTVRLRLGDWLTVAGVYSIVLEHLEAGRLRVGERIAASIGKGTRRKPYVEGWVVVNEGLAPVPPHKRNAGTVRERAHRAAKRALREKYKGRQRSVRSEAAKKYNQTWVLFTTAATVELAVAQYAARMGIEQTFRDWHHYWELRQVAMELSSEMAVCRLVGVVSLAYCLQMQLGWRLSQDTVGQRRWQQWTATDRLSLFWAARQVFDDPGYDWRGWLAEQWAHLHVADHIEPARRAA